MIGEQILYYAGAGAWPTWREDDKELFYLNGEGHLVAVQVELEGGPSVSPAEIITADPITSNPNSRFPSFDVHPISAFSLYRGRETREASQLTIAKFKGHHMQIAAAGMPFTLIYRSSIGRVEEVALKGMPLGGLANFPYEDKNFI